MFLLIRLIIFVRRHRRRRAARRRKEAVDKQIERDGSGAGSDAERLAAKMHGKVDLELFERRFARHANDEQLRQADTALLSFPPVLPRATKRRVNLLRVLLIVAERRKMLGGVPEITVQHLAKWVALICGWPQLGSTLKGAPERMADLEDAGDVVELAGRLRGLDYDRPVTKDLVALLQSPVKLAPVMSRLVAYEPAIDSTNGDGPLTVATAAQDSSGRVLGERSPTEGADKNGSAEH